MIRRGAGSCPACRRRCTHRHWHRIFCEEMDRWIDYLCMCYIEGLQPRQPHRITSGLFRLFTQSALTQVEYNTKHAHFTNAKHRNIDRQTQTDRQTDTFFYRLSHYIRLPDWSDGETSANAKKKKNRVNLTFNHSFIQPPTHTPPKYTVINTYSTNKIIGT